LSLHIAVIGANPANVEEIKEVVVDTLGSGVEITTATIKNYHELAEADLYVCLINRKQELEAAFSPEKVVALEFVPPVEYFLALSRVPDGTPVIIFNNSTAGTTVLLEHLKRYNLMYLNYEVVAYDELPHAEVAQKISSARFITGGIAYVGPGRDLYRMFGDALSPDTQIIVSPQRVATTSSISRLCNAFSSLYHQAVMNELKKLAAMDYLTQLPNRRTFDDVLQQEWRRAQRSNSPLSLAMLDIDFFKGYNDYNGHLAGDKCLQAIAQAIRNSMHRPADFCARYGGEEFALIMPDTEVAGAWHVLERIRKAVMDLNIVHKFSKVAPVITLSGGYTTTIPDDSTDTEKIFLNADKALYQAKYLGRNNVVFFAEQAQG
jgi:diguanylate cyclase (GGDEF)-like protein